MGNFEDIEVAMYCGGKIGSVAVRVRAGESGNCAAPMAQSTRPEVYRTLRYSLPVVAAPRLLCRNMRSAQPPEVRRPSAMAARRRPHFCASRSSSPPMPRGMSISPNRGALRSAK